MDEQNEIIVVEAEYLQLGSVRTASPTDLVNKASEVATALSDIIDRQGLATRIQGRDFVRVEGWTTLGAMLGVLPREVGVKRYEDGTYEAIVELIRTSDGAVIGRGSAICGMDEKDKRGKPTWGNRAEYARRSMAITRATGKAYRLAFSWIMTLAGYEATPAEEMTETQTNRKKPPRRQKSKPGNGNGNGDTFQDKSAAITWAMTQDVFEKEIIADNSWKKMWREQTPKDLVEASALWRQKVANKLADKALAEKEPIDEKAINDILHPKDKPEL